VNGRDLYSFSYENRPRDHVKVWGMGLKNSYFVMKDIFIFSYDLKDFLKDHRM